VTLVTAPEAHVTPSMVTAALDRRPRRVGRAPGGTSVPMPGRDAKPADEKPADESESPSEVDQAKRQDPDAPALGSVDDGDEVTDPPEPQEPG
jgi:hypothetical protein